MVEGEQHDSYAESSLSSRYSRFTQQQGFFDQRMDRGSEVERDFDEMQRIREGSIGALIARRRFLVDEMRRVNAQVRAEEDMASRVRGRETDEGLGMRFGGCRGMTLSQLQSLEDRIAAIVETRVATFFDRITASFEAEMAKAFETLIMMGVSGERGGYALLPYSQGTTDKLYASKIAQLPNDVMKDGKKIVMLAKPEEEGTKGRLRSTEVAKETPDEDWSCAFCDFSFTSKESYEEHCRKVIHDDAMGTDSCSPKKRKTIDINDEEEGMKKKNSKSVKLGEDVGCSKPASQTGQILAKAIGRDACCQRVEQKDDDSRSDDENGNGNENWCATCHVRTNSSSVMETHKKGKKHLKRAAACRG